MENKVYYKIGDKEITQNEVHDFVHNLGQEGMRFHNEEGFKQIAKELLNQELFLLEAKENKLDEEEDFKKELEFAKEQILKQYAMRNVLSKAKVSDEEVEKFYNENKNQFKDVYTFRASHILVDNEEEVKSIRKELEDAARFAELASEKSMCPSKERGGDLGEFQTGQMVPEFENALLDMNVGEISEPVKTQFGYHIIKLENKELVKENTFENYKENLRRNILSQKQQELYLNKSEELKKKYDVKEM